MRFSSGQNKGKIIDVGNAYKGALAKAIVNACTRWGVGLFKEKNPYERDNITMVDDGSDDSNITHVMTPNMPPSVSTPAPKTTNGTVVANSPFVVPSPAVKEEPKKTVSEQPPVATSTVNFPPIPPMPNQTVSASLNVKQEEKSFAPPMPKIPNPNSESAPVMPDIKVNTQPETPSLPMSKSNNMDSIRISDVQRVALNGILSMHNAEYESLAKEAFDSKGMTQPVPPKENLSYEEAVVVIKYGNDKFKKR
jgi:hypothetical protein